MRHEIQEPTLDEHGDEVHPAFAVAVVNTHSVTPGDVLFDSDIRHNRVVVLTIQTASRKRSLHRDWIHPERALIEVRMSQAQWGALVSSFGLGSGVPVTLSYTQDGFAPGLPFRSALSETADEAANTASEMYDRVREALAAVEEKPTKANIRSLRLAVDGVASNVKFAADSVTEHVENVVTKAKADIEAMVVMAADKAGLSASEAPVFELTHDD